MLDLQPSIIPDSPSRGHSSGNDGSSSPIPVIQGKKSRVFLRPNNGHFPSKKKKFNFFFITFSPYYTCFHLFARYIIDF